MPNMKNGQGELDVPIVSYTPRRLLATCQTRLALFARPQPSIKRTIFCWCLGPVLVDLVELLDGHFGLGDPDNVFGFEGLELDVLSTASAGRSQVLGCGDQSLWFPLDMDSSAR